MSFGVSVGDLIAVGTLASQLWTACREASLEFQDCGNLCQEVSLVIEGCRPTNPNSVLRVQDSKTISQLAESCNTTLSTLRNLLQRYNSLGSTTHRVRDTLGFAYAKADCDNIRRRLGEHLLVINTFLTGRQVTAPDSVEDVTPELFFALFTLLHDQTLVSPAINSSANLDLEDETNWQAFRAQVIAKSGIEGDYLDQKRSYVKACVQKFAKDQAKIVRSKAPTDSTSSQTIASPSVDISTSDSVQVQVPTPAKPKGTYKPWAIPWFSVIGIRYLQGVAVGFDNVITEPPCIWRYSKEEEWLCLLPEGWSRTPTMISREGNLNPAYYYSYNNLSCQRDNQPRMSRAYFYYCPFSCDTFTKRHSSSRGGWQLGYDPNTFKPSWWINDGGVVKTRSIAPSRSRFEMAVGLPTPQMVQYTGFFSIRDSLPWDLDDDVSRELVELLIGPNGIRRTDDYETITGSLPEEWYCKKISGSQNVFYINTDEAWKSTVHPARFTDPESEVSNQLPDGWDRRLDSWGNLFFVDHHTKSASREDPRFNRKVDQNTGLPMGWRSIKDHKDREFFFRKQGRMIIGTYDATTMNSKDLRRKKFIDTEPKNGEAPNISDIGRELLGESKTEQVHTVPPPPLPPPYAASPAHSPSLSSEKRSVGAEVANNQASVAISSSTRLSQTAALLPMTEDDKAKYYAMFEAANKESKWFINAEEAMEQSHAFGLPPGIALDIWEKSDANHDRRWNIDEYANAMHEIMIQTGKQEAMTRSQDPGAVPPPTMDTSKMTMPTDSGSFTLDEHVAALKLSEVTKS